MFKIDDQKMKIGPKERTWDISDIEFDHINKRVVFIENVSRDVVIRKINKSTGDWDGDFITVDGTGLATFSSIPNGPEWAVSERGIELYYIRKKNKSSKVDVIYRATECSCDSGCTWDLTPLENSEGCGPVEPSKCKKFSYPRLLYVRNKAGWWCDDNPALGGLDSHEVEVEGATRGEFVSGSPVRFIPDQRAVVMAYKDPGTSEMKLVWRDLTESCVKETVLHTYEAGTTIVSVGAIRAPNRNDNRGPAYILYALVNHLQIDSYLVRLIAGRPVPEGEYTLRPPPSPPNKYLIDDENFVASDNEPYISVTKGDSKVDKPENSEIWVISAFPAGAPLYRRVTRELNESRKRRDPEPLQLDGGTFIYYRERNVKGRHILRRAATGL